jgi:CRISPR/Cas system-associated exonuclease Cas4 (RecB family)
MILTFKGAYGSTIDLDRDGELRGYEFVEPPIEYRFLRAGSPISDWTSPVPGFISLLRPVTINAAVQTRGLDVKNLAIETRGLVGTFILLVWPRE